MLNAGELLLVIYKICSCKKNVFFGCNILPLSFYVLFLFLSLFCVFFYFGKCCCCMFVFWMKSKEIMILFFVKICFSKPVTTNYKNKECTDATFSPLFIFVFLFFVIDHNKTNNINPFYHSCFL